MALALGLIMAVSGCSGGGDGDGKTTAGGDHGSPTVTITPGQGTDHARPDKGIAITASAGTLSSVQVRAKGVDVPGRLTADRHGWRSTWTLVPGARYSVSATATGDNGKTTTATSTFRTIADTAATKITNVIPNTNETVGTGMPIIVQFNKTV